MQFIKLLRNRWVKVSAALVLAFMGAFLLTETLFYPEAPLVRSSFTVRTILLFKRIKDFFPQRLHSTIPPPWVFRPLPNYPTPRNYQYPTLPPMGGGGGYNPVISPGLVYPTAEVYPTYNPDRRITIGWPGGSPDGSYPTPTVRPVFEPPTIMPTQPPASSPSVSATELLSLINQERRNEGASELKFNAALDQAAQKHADTTTGCKHYGPDGSSPFDRVVEAGYPTPWVGENIACGVNSAAQAFGLWMSSSPHYANMVNKDWKSAGIGIARGFWVFVGGPV